MAISKSTFFEFLIIFFSIALFSSQISVSIYNFDKSSSEKSGILNYIITL